MIFSQRYMRAIEVGRLPVDLPPAVRAKLATGLRTFNAELYVQRDPNDNWRDRTSIFEEVERELCMEHGWETVPGIAPGTAPYGEAIALIIRDGDAPLALDVIELLCGYVDRDDKPALHQRVNRIMELHDCPWRLLGGEFFKLDADFVGARLAVQAHQCLEANQFSGAVDEYTKARQEQTADDIKDAILYAGKSFESMLSVLTGLRHANANKLVSAILTDGFLDDLPDSIRQGFADQVLKTLPFLRNKLGGHGQGAEVLNVPPVYGELAIQLAAALHNFFIAKYLERQPSAPRPAALHPSQTSDDELPF